MNRVVNIYALIDPFSQEIRYVGMTTMSLGERLRLHVKGVNGGEDTYKGRWVRRLLRFGKWPIIVQVAAVPESDWSEAERYWIAYFKSVGCSLTNGTDGGDGVLGTSWTEERRRRVSAKLTGRTFPDRTYYTPEYLAKVAEKSRSQAHTEEANAKIRASKLGKKLTPEHVAASVAGKKRERLARKSGAP